MRVITFGTFDLFHIGHLNVLKRARALGDELYVGLSSDELNFSKKGRYPIYPFEQRSALLSHLRCVDLVFSEDSLDLKVDYIKQHKADILVMGDDWAGKFDFCAPYCKVVYLPRTPSISTTEIIEIIREQ
jgi:choline-phosphate cytidylyltransferase/glycerol-3-phosphate cytidylyltransferase